MNFRTQFPELNPTQIKILYRVLCEEVIGSTPENIGVERELIELRVRDAQRQRLADYLEIKEEV